MALVRYFFVFSGITLIARISGFIRDFLMAMIFGSHYMADVFLVAFRMPIVCRSVLVDEQLNYVFVPNYSKKLSKDVGSAIKLANNVLSLLIIALLLIILFVECFMPYILRMAAPGFFINPDKAHALIRVGRIMYPYLLVGGPVSVIISVLQSHNKFYGVAIPSITTNLFLIFTMFTCIVKIGTVDLWRIAHFLGFGVLVAGVVQITIGFVLCRCNGIKLNPLVKPKIDDDLKCNACHSAPIMMNSIMLRLNNWINQILLSLIAGGISYMYYAERVVQLPISLIGISISAVLLPNLSRHIAKKERDTAIHIQNRSLEFSLVLGIPAALTLCIFSSEIINLLFGKGRFLSSDLETISDILLVNAFGIVPFVLSNILLQNFYSQGNTKTPFKLSFIRVAVNTVLDLLLISKYKYVGVAFSTAVSAWIYLLAIFLTVPVSYTHLTLPTTSRV